MHSILLKLTLLLYAAIRYYVTRFTYTPKGFIKLLGSYNIVFPIPERHLVFNLATSLGVFETWTCRAASGWGCAATATVERTSVRAVVHVTAANEHRITGGGVDKVVIAYGVGGIATFVTVTAALGSLSR